jgi:hypothetical protein
LGVWDRGGRTVGGELLEIGFEFCYLARELVSHVVPEIDSKAQGIMLGIKGFK